jgi:uncharacterized protein YcaQ
MRVTPAEMYGEYACAIGVPRGNTYFASFHCTAEEPSSMSVTFDQLRRYAIARTLFKPTTLARAIEKLGFVQADPIRAPARAQDLTLRHRVKNYRAGDLERRYAELAVEEDFFVNYGFLPRSSYALMHPRGADRAWDATTRRQAGRLLRFVRERETVHPREVEERFGLGRVTNYWGGSSSATTHLLDKMHYRGLLRVVRRDRGVRVYAASQPSAAGSGARARARQLDALVDVVVRAYAPLPALSLNNLVSRLRYAVPQWQDELKPALARAKQRLGSARIAGVDYYWPADERPASPRHARDERLRLLAPFDPLVWDRRRFALFWGWAYRFEAYTPAPKRKLGYYALPLLWRDEVIGWANVTFRGSSQGANGSNVAVVSGPDRLDCQLGFVTTRPNEPAFERGLEAELAHLRAFLDRVG